MDFGIHFHTVGLNQLAASLVVTLALDALHLGEQLCEQATQFLVVIDADIGLTVTLHVLDDIVLLAMLIAPLADELAVTHVGLLDILARNDAGQLGHQTIHDILVILSLISIHVGENAKFHQLRIGKIIEGEQVGTALLER